MLWLGLLMRSTGIPASQRLGIRDEVTALDFDLAVSHRLFRLDRDERKDLAKRIAYECAKAFLGGGEEEDDSILSSEFIKNDPYADEHTQLM